MSTNSQLAIKKNELWPMYNNKICEELTFWIEGHARESEHSDLKRSTTW
jgi:hypothetical protein